MRMKAGQWAVESTTTKDLLISEQNMLDSDLLYVFQAEGILRAWATPALKDDYGSDPVVTKIWNTTMMEVR